MTISEAGKNSTLENDTRDVIKQLADDMDVSVTDLMCLANSVANSLQQDKVTIEQVEGLSENDKVDLVRAYACHAQRKIQQFHSAYLTNGNVKLTIRNSVYGLLV